MWRWILPLFLIVTQASAEQCLYDVTTAFSELPKWGQRGKLHIDNRFPKGTMRPFLGLFKKRAVRHIQGIARLENSKTMVMSGNASGGSYLYSTHDAQLVNVLHLSKKYKHPGGIQSFENVVVVGTDYKNGRDSQIRFFDYQNPSHPVELEHLLISGHDKVDSVGIAKLKVPHPDAEKFLVISLANYRKQISFYLSSGADLYHPNNRFILLGHREMKDVPDWSSYQNVDLLMQCDGQLYLLGSRKTKPFFKLPWGGKDYLDLFYVNLAGETVTPELNHLWRRYFTCPSCYFSAGGGAYVDQDVQELKFYATGMWPRHLKRRPSYIRASVFSASMQ